MYDYILRLPLQEAIKGAAACPRSTPVILVVDNDHCLLHSTKYGTTKYGIRTAGK